MTPLPRAEFPVTERWAYFNHAGVAPLPRSAVAAMGAYARRVMEEGSRTVETHGERLPGLRAAGAELMGVSADDVAFVKNTSEGLGFVASGLRWGPGERVLVPACEFPSNVYPWVALGDVGVEVETIEPVGPAHALPLEVFEARLRGGGVRLVAVSWVQFGRGFRVDLPGLAALCREHGALLCVDAIQGLGVLPASFEAWGVDFAAADGHKWMLGPEGVGFLYVRSERQNLLRPLEPGWASVRHRTEWENREWVPDDSARRFEGGSPNVAGGMALGASLDLLLGAGVEAVWHHVDGLCRRLCEGLAEAGVAVLGDRGDGRSGIVTLAAEDPAGLCEGLATAGFVVSPRGGGVRVSPHGYNTAEEVDALVEAVAKG